jgi:peptidyl-prolyl cis-trans isomerase B (cyclophilin B)
MVPYAPARVVRSILAFATLYFLAGGAGRGQTVEPPPRKAPAVPAYFTTTLSLQEMKNKQAVLETDLGTIVIELLPAAAPNHAGYFIKLARAGEYDGTTFHRVVKYGIVQGGDPLSRDPSKVAAYGTGGLGVLRAEVSGEKHGAGAVSGVQRPGDPDSAGAQFFICVTAQPALDGKYTVFGRVVEGLEVAQTISEAPADATGKATARIVIRAVTIRDTPPPEPEPFSSHRAEALAAYHPVLETSLGNITLELFPDRAPDHVRNFLRLAQLGVYDGMAFHRVVAGFVAQTGSLTSRATPLTARQRAAVRNLAPEFNDTKHVRGIVSMARGDDPGSANTSFFLVLGPAPSLDGKYTVFGRIVDGLDVLDSIEKTPLDGEAPRTRIELVTVRVGGGER